MSEPGGPRSGGKILADALQRNGVERVFCVPGESYLALLDGLYDSPVKVTLARQEGGAAMMAEAWGKLTGRPGVVIATRGPGATNASAGLHIGRQVRVGSRTRDRVSPNTVSGRAQLGAPLWARPPGAANDEVSARRGTERPAVGQAAAVRGGGLGRGGRGLSGLADRGGVAEPGGHSVQVGAHGREFRGGQSGVVLHVGLDGAGAGA